ncbi:hypothetical protein GJ633_13780 [Halorubrum sp. CBA1125]|uniref:hypothetical protein n=1 Tax=Halorubrum sp. CBA1125 TaxID=2668072 RepID=UPI0012E8FF98|nr:hypothetical protein [Halorubrum sp. CBA1125]MUW15578.1 hypothetical protein [Halorubrum sp. CBA1125]
MRRRQLLAGTVATAVTGLGGCLGGDVCLGNCPSCTGKDSWPPTVDVEEPELAPGDSDVFDIQVDGITDFSFDSRLYKCGPSDAPVQFGDVEFRNPIDAQADSCPPIYLWDDCTSATLHVTVHAAPDADPGTYEYGFSVRETIGERHSKDYEYVVTVSEE